MTTRSGETRSATMFLAALCTGACGALTWLAGLPPAPPAAAAVGGGLEIIAAKAVVPDPRTPVRLEIAKIGLDSGIEALARNADGTVGTPNDWNDVAWYSEGVVPGEPGPAVIVGHRDSAANGPAVFYRLSELSPGDEVSVTRHDGTTRRFVVIGLERVAKAQFPTAEVYAPSTQPLLRLITCIGDFDAQARSYVDNLVVVARAV